MLCAHCANSPPSQISTALGSRSTNGLSARNTSAGCSRPGVWRRSGPFGGPAVEGGARLIKPYVIRLSSRARQRSAALPVGLAADQQAPALFRFCAREQRRVGVDGDEAQLGIERTALAPLGGEIERLAEQHDQVGATTRSGKAPSVASAMPRGLSITTAGAPMAASSRSRIARPPGRHLRAGQHDRPLRSGDGGEDRIGVGLRQRGRRGFGRSGQTIGGSRTAVEYVRRQAQMHRPGPARCGDADRLADVMAPARLPISPSTTPCSPVPPSRPGGFPESRRDRVPRSRRGRTAAPSATRRSAP